MNSRKLVTRAVGLLVLIAGPGRLDPANAKEPGRFAAEVGVGTRSVRTVAFGDDVPASHAEGGVRAAIAARITRTIWASVSGYGGGAWLEFENPATAGTLEESSWSVRAGLDFRRSVSFGTVYWGGGYEYGEVRSSLSVVDGAGRRAESDGPKVYTSGGYFHGGVSDRLWGPVGIFMEVGGSAYRGRAKHQPTTATLRWLGTSLEANLGLHIGS